MDELFVLLSSSYKKLVAFDGQVRSILARVKAMDDSPDDDGYGLVVEALQNYLQNTGAPLEEFLSRYVKLLKLYLYD